jgi:hypothetical protein
MPIIAQPGAAVNIPSLTENHGVPGSNPGPATPKKHTRRPPASGGTRRVLRRDNQDQPCWALVRVDAGVPGSAIGVETEPAYGDVVGEP